MHKYNYFWKNFVDINLINKNKMDKLILYFFTEEAYIDFPKSLQSLYELISFHFFLTKSNIKKLNICYNNIDSALLSIKNENDYKSFLKKNINNIFLDAGQNNEIYDEYLSRKEKKEENEDIKRLNDLMKKDEEFNKLYETKFKKEESEIEDINKLIESLNSRKIEIIKHIKKNKQILENEHLKIKKELSELKQKLNIK